jgi:hypothetical protein
LRIFSVTLPFDGGAKALDQEAQPDLKHLGLLAAPASIDPCTPLRSKRSTSPCQFAGQAEFLGDPARHLLRRRARRRWFQAMRLHDINVCHVSAAVQKAAIMPQPYSRRKARIATAVGASAASSR